MRERRRRRYKPSRTDNALDLLESGARKLGRLIFTGKTDSGGGGGGGGGGGSSRSEYRWITHEVWEPEILFDLLFIVIFFPWFIGDMISKRAERNRRLREQRHQKRITRYRAASGAANRRRRK